MDPSRTTRWAKNNCRFFRADCCKTSKWRSKRIIGFPFLMRLCPRDWWILLFLKNSDRCENTVWKTMKMHENDDTLQQLYTSRAIRRDCYYVIVTLTHACCCCASLLATVTNQSQLDSLAVHYSSIPLLHHTYRISPRTSAIGSSVSKIVNNSVMYVLLLYSVFRVLCVYPLPFQNRKDEPPWMDAAPDWW